jgi:hypothetical protein
VGEREIVRPEGWRERTLALGEQQLSAIASARTRLKANGGTKIDAKAYEGGVLLRPGPGGSEPVTLIAQAEQKVTTFPARRIL